MTANQAALWSVAGLAFGALWSWADGGRAGVIFSLALLLAVLVVRIADYGYGKWWFR